jgi:SAM-dependent methyltransferase
MRGQKPLYNRFWIRYLRKVISKGRILDTGCGRGFFLKYAEKHYETFGIDISKYGIYRAKIITPKSDLQIGLVHNLGYKNDVFDIITSYDLLEHLKTPTIALGEYNRVLKTGGILVISVPNIHSIGKKWKKDKWFGYRDETHQTILSNQQWMNSLEKNGFDIKDTFYDGLWDSPYWDRLPAPLQHLVFKWPVTLLFWLGFKFPKKFGENICIVAVKKTEV